MTSERPPKVALVQKHRIRHAQLGSGQKALSAEFCVNLVKAMDLVLWNLRSSFDEQGRKRSPQELRAAPWRDQKSPRASGLQTHLSCPGYGHTLVPRQHRSEHLFRRPIPEE